MPIGICIGAVRRQLMTNALNSSLKRTYSQSASAPARKIQRLASHSPSTATSTAKKAHEMPPRASGTKRKSNNPKPRTGTSSRGRPIANGPIHNLEHIKSAHESPLKDADFKEPRNCLGNWLVRMYGVNIRPVNEDVAVNVNGSNLVNVSRSTIQVVLPEPHPAITAVGDHRSSKKEADRLATLSAIYQLHALGLLYNPPTGTSSENTVTLTDGASIDSEKAKDFIEYYCRRFGFQRPDISYVELKRGGQAWEAAMSIDGRQLGMGSGSNKKQSEQSCYLDVTRYLDSCDSSLWKTFLEAKASGSDLGLAPPVYFSMMPRLSNDIRDLCVEIKDSSLYKTRLGLTDSSGSYSSQRDLRPPPSAGFLKSKSQNLLSRLKEYRKDPDLQRMRMTRESLPVYGRAEEVISQIEEKEVTIVMAATGSGKTTQLPQMILDHYTDRARGAECNIICTQPRRLAAISVADRVAKERGETLGKSIGYQVRFESKPPEPHGSVTFCTIGVFLKRLQSSLDGSNSSLDSVSHVVVDEVHERDVDTDLLLVVLKRLMAQRKAIGKPIKVVLMSATIDPTLFQKYFPDEKGTPAEVISIPGRSYPVEKSFMNDFISNVHQSPLKWIFREESVVKYVNKELGSASPVASLARQGVSDEDLELPYPLIAATISYVMQQTSEGHCLVFLPGWDDIIRVNKALLEPFGSLGIDFNSPNYTIHMLHSTVPLADQQRIFEPPKPGERRVILSTNIAETSVTIPDVVYVVDTAKIKENRYDPSRHMSSLVTAWVGSSNLNQRAGRAGRHRPGQYYGILGRERADSLSPYQTVEIKRTDLSNVVMHIKALNFPNMTVEEVLDETIEPPDAARVASAISSLQMVGALDEDKNLTSLGRVLLQIPIDANLGRLVLYGSFYRCLDQALTLAALLSNRDPFVSPMHLKQQANEKKNSWTPQDYRSDVLAALQTYNTWWSMQSRREYISANRFCVDNFVSKPTFLMVQQVKGHILQSLFSAGVIEISAGGSANVTFSGRKAFGGAAALSSVPEELNVNAGCLPLLAALITSALQPKFAVRSGEMKYRTKRDRVTFMHPSSVNNRKRIVNNMEGEKQLYAFAEKRQNVSTGNSNAQTFLVSTTRIDPLTYMLFGAYRVTPGERGLECDDWLPIVGSLGALDDVRRLKNMIEACMLRVFDGIAYRQRKKVAARRGYGQGEPEAEFGDEDEGVDRSLSQQEVKELDLLSRDLVSILNHYAEERGAGASMSRPVTPLPRQSSLRPSLSGYNTPNAGPMFMSRPSTPSRSVFGSGRF